MHIGAPSPSAHVASITSDFWRPRRLTHACCHRHCRCTAPSSWLWGCQRGVLGVVGGHAKQARISSNVSSLCSAYAYAEHRWRRRMHCPHNHLFKNKSHLQSSLTRDSQCSDLAAPPLEPKFNWCNSTPLYSSTPTPPLNTHPPIHPLPPATLWIPPHSTSTTLIHHAAPPTSLHPLASASPPVQHQYSIWCV
jgi:hypothetical protein